MRAIESLTGQKIILPEGMERLVVTDQSDPKATYLNIPPKVSASFDVELSDEQLEAAAGGVASVIGGEDGGGCIYPPIIKWPPFTIGF